MAKTASKKTKVPEHYHRHLGYIRQWIDGFEAAGKPGPTGKDTLRQIQLFLQELDNA